MSISKTTLSRIVATSAMLGSLLLANTAFAATAHPEGFARGARPAVVGTVATVSGNTLTVTSRAWAPKAPSTTTPPAATTYTVDATSATVTKNGQASSVSAIAVGDMLMIQGTVTGTAVTATTIRDGMGRGGQMFGQKPKTGTAPKAPAVTGNGKPVVGGTVTAVNGASVTMTNKSNDTYTVDTTSATITKPGVASATVTNIAVGDEIVVQGTINGTSVVASSVVDSGTPPSTSGNAPGTTPAPRTNILKGIGGFFSHLLGFF